LNRTGRIRSYNDYKVTIFIATDHLKKIMAYLRMGSAVLLLVLVTAFIPTASAWNVQSLSVTPPQGPIAPGTPVVVTGTVHFGPSYEGLSTFINDDTFDLYTDLANPKWTVTKIQTFEDRPTEKTTIFDNKEGVRARIDGWDLSYGRQSFDLEIRLEGTAPDVQTAQSKTIIRIQELDPSANTVEGSVTTRKYTISPQTPAPTLTLAPTPVPVTTVQTTETLPPTPTVKQTYAPGPDALAICGVLGVTCLAVALGRKR
jgi:hypothetical protein